MVVRPSERLGRREGGDGRLPVWAQSKRKKQNAYKPRGAWEGGQRCQNDTNCADRRSVTQGRPVVLPHQNTGDSEPCKSRGLNPSG